MRRLARALVPMLPLLAACSGSPPARPQTAATQPVQRASADTKVVAFDVSLENLNVDTVGMRDGNMKPDGSRDHAFSATIEGPVNALFLIECDAKGTPVYGFRADTLVGGQELPRPLGGVIDTGQMTLGIGAVENGKFINEDSGAVELSSGTHALTLYAPNTGLLTAGDHVCLYVRTPDDVLVEGPVATY